MSNTIIISYLTGYLLCVLFSRIEIRKHTQAIQRVRELHQPISGWDSDCAHCSVINGVYEAVFWPCPTIKALDGEQ